MELCHLELKLSGCNKEVAALYSDHHTIDNIDYVVYMIYDYT